MKTINPMQLALNQKGFFCSQEGVFVPSDGIILRAARTVIQRENNRANGLTIREYAKELKT